MNKLVQQIHPGRLQSVFNIQKRQFKEENLRRRLWFKEPSLWPKDNSRRLDIPSNLAWLDFPDTLEPLFTEIGRTRESAVTDGLFDWVFLALGAPVSPPVLSFLSFHCRRSTAYLF